MAREKEQSPEFRIESPEWLREQAAELDHMADCAATNVERERLKSASRNLTLRAIQIGHEIAAYGSGGLNGRLDQDPFDLDKLTQGEPPSGNETAGE